MLDTIARLAGRYPKSLLSFAGRPRSRSQRTLDAAARVHDHQARQESRFNQENHVDQLGQAPSLEAGHTCIGRPIQQMVYAIRAKGISRHADQDHRIRRRSVAPHEGPARLSARDGGEAPRDPGGSTDVLLPAACPRSAHRLGRRKQVIRREYGIRCDSAPNAEADVGRRPGQDLRHH